jgi:hypothetical protein
MREVDGLAQLGHAENRAAEAFRVINALPVPWAEPS